MVDSGKYFSLGFASITLWIMIIFSTPLNIMAETGEPIKVSQQLRPSNDYDLGDHIMRFLSTTDLSTIEPTVPFKKGDSLHFKASIDHGRMCFRIQGEYNYELHQRNIAYEAVNRTRIDYQWTVPDIYSWIVEIYNSGDTNATVTLSVEREPPAMQDTLIRNVLLIIIHVVIFIVIGLIIWKLVSKKRSPIPQEQPSHSQYIGVQDEPIDSQQQPPRIDREPKAP